MNQQRAATAAAATAAATAAAAGPDKMAYIIEASSYIINQLSHKIKNTHIRLICEAFKT